MDIYKLKFTKLQNEIFRLLCIKAGTALNQRTIAKKLKVSPTAVAKALKGLKKENLIQIKKDKTMNLTLIELNLDNSKAIMLKRTENLKMIYESGIVEFLEDKFPGTAIILFGSYSYGYDIWSEDPDLHSSDIDIAIIGSKRKDINTKKFNKILEREVIINFYPSFKSIHKNLRNNILNGIVLAGGIEL